MSRLAAYSFVALTGCSFTEIPPAPGSVAVNSCEADDDCGGGKCRSGMCVSTSSSLRPLLLEVTPPTSVSDVGGLSFYTELANASGNVAIGPVGTVTTTIVATVDPTCSFQGPPPDRTAFAPSAGTIPAAVSFIPSERVLGIATSTYRTATGAGEPRAGFPYSSTQSLPSGTYDIYVEPRAIPGSPVTCDVPPLLVRAQDISGTVMLAIELPEKSTLKLVVRGPAADESLTGWSVAVLDSLSGRVLSVPTTLPGPTMTDAGSEYEQAVAFIPAHVVEEGELKPDAALTGREVVRLSPPESPPEQRIAPTFFFQRDGLRLGSNDPSAPDIVDLTPPNGYLFPSAIPVNVTIQGQTSELDSGLPVAAAVTLVSKEIEGASKQASFTTTIQVDETGTFTTGIPPGTYSVRATPPPSSGLSAAETEWVIRAGAVGSLPPVQAGKTIELPSTPFVSGEASANGRPVFGATASTVVSPFAAQNTVLERALSQPDALPRTSSDLVEGNGRFDISVDPGMYDFFVQPETRSRYPWLVLPSVNVPEGGVDLQHRRLTLPFVHRGNVVIGDTRTRVPGALIRAYVAVTWVDPDDLTMSVKTAVIPVAETRSDNAGAFELLIPASLDKQ